MSVTEKRIKAISILPKEEKPQTFMDEMKEDAIMGVVEGLIPKLGPMIDKATVKLEEYFGDDEKIFLIRRQGNQPAKVIVLSNVVGSYTIINKAEVDGEDIVITKEFRASKDCIVGVHDTAAFVQKLLSGEFTNQQK